MLEEIAVLMSEIGRSLGHHSLSLVLGTSLAAFNNGKFPFFSFFGRIVSQEIW